MKNHEAFVKENHHLSTELVTIFTQIGSNENIQPVLKLVFKGTDKLPAKLTPPLGTHYRLKQLLETIKHLSNRFNMFSHTNFAILRVR